jgi:5-exo-hydroxycamphor dehydrogenase
MAWERGARAVIIEGTRRGASRLALAERFGCLPINIHDVSPEDRRALVLDVTHGHGADVVIDAAGSVESFAEAIALSGRGGRVLLPGVAVPVGEAAVRLYEDISVKNLAVHGVWASDTAHLWRAVSIVLSGRYPLADMVSHRFAVKQANEALAAVARREATKAVLVQD